jgi:uncharacterized membrane protein
MLKTTLRWLLAVFFILAGSNHFISPQTYMEIMPPYLPWPLGLVYVSGVAEIVPGIAVLFPRWRRWAGWGLIALLVAVFPANMHMALNGFHSVPAWILWARLPVQFLLIGWVYWICLTSPGQARRVIQESA